MVEKIIIPQKHGGSVKITLDKTIREVSGFGLGDNLVIMAEKNLIVIKKLED